MQNKIDSIIALASQYQTNNWIEALQILQNGLSEFVGNPKLLTAIGDLYSSKQNTEKAMEYYNQACTFSLGSEDILYKIALLHMSKFNFVAAKKCLEEISNPSCFVIFQKAVCCIHLKLNDLAISLLESTLNDPIIPEAVFFMLCEQYITFHKFDKAKEMLDNLRRKYPNNDKIHFLTGYYYFQKENWVAGYNYLIKAKNTGFEFLGNIKLLAVAAYNIGLFSQSIEFYKQALRFSPFDSTIFESLIKIYLELGEKGKAKILAKKIPVFVPKSRKLIELIKEINEKN